MSAPITPTDQTTRATLPYDGVTTVPAGRDRYELRPCGHSRGWRAVFDRATGLQLTWAIKPCYQEHFLADFRRGEGLKGRRGPLYYDHTGGGGGRPCCKPSS